VAESLVLCKERDHMEDITKFDIEKNVILLFNNNKNAYEDRTLSISSIRKSYYYGNFSGYEIYFKSSPIKFFYKLDNVVCLYKLKSLDICNKDVYVNGEIYPATQVELFDQGYTRVFFNKESILSKNVILKPSTSKSNKDIFTYYKDLANHAELITTEDEPLFFLSKNYHRISPSSKSVLFQYFSGYYNKTVDQDRILVPFDYNQSQYQAIKSALTSTISIIEGPPGTGKTQTILNLIGNIIFRNQNCAVVSNNNTAIDNISEKLEEEGLSFVSASLGSKDNVSHFFENNNNEELESRLNEIGNETYPTNSSIELDKLTHLMQQIHESEIMNAHLQTDLNEITSEKRIFDHSQFMDINLNRHRSSQDYLRFLHRLEDGKITFIERWIFNIKYHVKISKIEINVLLKNLEKLFYEKRIFEINAKLIELKNQMAKQNKVETKANLKRVSKSILLTKILHHYKGLNLMEFNQDSYKMDYDRFLQRYPVVLSTSHSLLNNAPKGFLFDYLIIDEASQGDLLSNVLAMSCAKKVVVVGDSRQLQQIDDERLFEQSRVLSRKYNIPIQFRYEENSILKSVKAAVKDVPTTLLREHYRCAPDIIGFCNKMFYNNELIPMTVNTGQHIEIIRTVPGNHARRNPNGTGLYNQREIDEIIRILPNQKQTDIGIITPFRYQANLIQSSCGNNHIEADTIHKFQGRQKDSIILSFVVNNLETDLESVENRLYDFVTNKKLLNVAISRGKNKITAIVSDKVYHSNNNVIVDFIKYAEYLYGNSVTSESTITSVFDYLYSEHTNELVARYKENRKEHFTELLMCDITNEILSKVSYIGYAMHIRLSNLISRFDSFSAEEIRYINHPWTHVDFLFYNKVSKERLFVLEIDGIRYHEQDKKQSVHDEIKNRVLAMNNLPIYRFKTNESNEKQKLLSILSGFIH